MKYVLYEFYYDGYRDGVTSIKVGESSWISISKKNFDALKSLTAWEASAIQVMWKIKGKKAKMCEASHQVFM